MSFCAGNVVNENEENDKYLKPILQGYQGMVDGGDHILPAEWKTVSNIIQRVCIFCLFISMLYVRVLPITALLLSLLIDERKGVPVIKSVSLIYPE